MKKNIDDLTLTDLIVESEDMQVDALRQVRSTLPDLVEVRESRAEHPVDLDRVRAFNDRRRWLLRNGGLGLGALRARGLLGAGFGAALHGIVGKPAHAQEQLDVQILQTAASLEILAVNTYEAALGLPFFGENPTVVAFAQTTRDQHAEHRDAFNQQAEALGGQPQAQANPVGQQVVDQALPGLDGYVPVVDLAATLEQVATQTYVQNVMTLEDGTAKEIMASIMGVEAQHLATLRAVGALLEASAPDLITVPPAGNPVDVSALPGAAGSAAFREPFETTENALPPESGAVQ